MTREHLDAIRARVDFDDVSIHDVIPLLAEVKRLHEENTVLVEANEGEPWAWQVLTKQRDAALAEVERLRDAHAMAVQVSGELCEKCGWAIKFPGEKCRCELLAEVERLIVEREWARDVLEKRQARITELRATNDALVNRGLRELLTLRDKAREDSFKRGVAAMREAAASHFSVVAPYDYIAPRIRALPDPEDKQ